MRLTRVIIVLVLLANLQARAQQTDSLFLNAAITKLQHAREYTLNLANLMPEEKYGFNPVPEEMSFGKQLLHLSSNMGWLCSAFLGGGVNPVAKTDLDLSKKDEVIDVLHKSYDFALTALKQFDAAHLADQVTFFAGPLNKLQIINLLNDHQTHHRAQAIVYLRLNGIKPPAYTGW